MMWGYLPYTANEGTTRPNTWKNDTGYNPRFSELRCRAAIICSASQAAVYKQMVKQMVMRTQPKHEGKGAGC